MSPTRRSFLGVLAGIGISALRNRNATAATISGPAASFEVDRLVAAYPRHSGQDRVKVWQRRYRASATVTLLSIPVFSRADVGSGFTIIEDAPAPEGSTVAIQFGAGSWPESAHGLNRLGYIQEVVVEGGTGSLAECAYFAFMTSSQEKSVEQARKALETSDGDIPYAAAEGIGRDNVFSSRLDRIAFPGKLTWRDYRVLIEKVRETVAGGAPTERREKRFDAGEGVPATFLYAVRGALQSPDAKTSGMLIYNGKEFQLRTSKEPDESTGAKLAAKGIAKDAARVMRLDATLRELATGIVTPFHLWYARGEEQMPPLRFDYQARSFLKLSFEADPAPAPPAMTPRLAGRAEISMRDIPVHAKNLHTGEIE